MSSNAGRPARLEGQGGLGLDWGRPYTWLVAALWGLLLISVPVTSFPPLAERMGFVTVAPLALIPLGLLVVVWLLPDLWRGGRLPYVVWPLLLFCLAALLSAGAAWFLPLEPFKGQTVFKRELRALLTLAAGVSFYLCAARLPVTSRLRTWSLAALYLGAAAALAWGTVQADYVLTGLNNVPQELNEIHRLFSIRDLERNRVTGLAFEPSWLGDQLVVLYLPLWLGAILSGQSLLARRWGALVLELPLLLWGGWILLMTRSRVALLAALVVAGLLVVLGFWRLGGWLARRLVGGRADRDRWPARLTSAVLVLAGLGLIAAVGYGLLLRVAQVDSRMSRALAIPSQMATIRRQVPYNVPYEIANRFAFAERVVYWQASLHPFAQYPLLGVGPGNAGFLFEAGVPSYGYGLVETRAYLEAAQPAFPNPKNLWIRLLSETGFVGFALYASWLALIGLLAWRGRRAADGHLRWLSAAALLSLPAQAVEGFSLDSFALPQVWLVNGLFTAVLIERLRRK